MILVQPALADVLQGSIEEESLRLGRNQNDAALNGQVPATAPLRIQRPYVG